MFVIKVESCLDFGYAKSRIWFLRVLRILLLLSIPIKSKIVTLNEKNSTEIFRLVETFEELTEIAYNWSTKLGD